MNPVKNLTIQNYKNWDSFTENINDPSLKAIDKWRNHPSILAIVSGYKYRADFPVNFVSEEDIPAKSSAGCLLIISTNHRKATNLLII